MHNVSEAFVLSLLAEATDDTMLSRRNASDLAMEYAASAVEKANHVVQLLDNANSGEQHIVLVNRARYVRDRAELAKLRAEIMEIADEGWSDLEKSFFELA